MPQRNGLIPTLLAFVALLAGCAASAGVSRDAALDAAPPPQRTLQVGMQAVSEPPTISDHGIGNNVGGREHYFVFHAPLTVYDGSEQLLPRIAEKIPALS